VGGQSPFGNLVLDLPHDGQPLPPRQRRPDDAGDDDQRKSVERSEAATELDEQGELDGGEDDEQEEEPHTVSMPHCSAGAPRSSHAIH
jgi:hypothetical protein